MIEGIKTRVVFTAGRLSGESRIERRDPKVLQERASIRTGTAGPEIQILQLPREFLALVGALLLPRGAQPMRNTDFRLRIDDCPRDLGGERVQSVGAREAEKATGTAVRVDVRDGL